MIPLMQYASDLETIDPGALGAFMALGLVFVAFFVVFAIIAYIYMGITLMKTAKRLNVQPAWLAWIPVGNIYLMLKMGKQPWWPILLMLSIFVSWVPFVGSLIYFGSIMALGVYCILAQWKICEARQRPGWWAILALVIPFWSPIMWGILAWGK